MLPSSRLAVSSASLWKISSGLPGVSVGGGSVASSEAAVPQAAATNATNGTNTLTLCMLPPLWLSVHVPDSRARSLAAAHTASIRRTHDLDLVAVGIVEVDGAGGQDRMLSGADLEAAVTQRLFQIVEMLRVHREGK